MQVHHATLSFYLNPTVGFGKQIARIIAPEKFDGQPDGLFDNTFREATLRRLRQQRRRPPPNLNTSGRWLRAASAKDADESA